MPVINYKNLKTQVPARNFDNKTLTTDYDFALQDPSGNYGVMSFFKAVKSFFKGIAALGTLTATSRIPVTDSNGNVTYTTPNAIKSTLGLATTTDLNSYVGKLTKTQLTQTGKEYAIPFTALTRGAYHFKFYAVGSSNTYYYAEGHISSWDGTYGVKTNYRDTQITNITYDGENLNVSISNTCFRVYLTTTEADNWITTP